MGFPLMAPATLARDRQCRPAPAQRRISSRHVGRGGAGHGSPAELISLDDWRRQFEVNVFGVIAVIQRSLPMLRKGGGRIVNMSSIGGRVAQPFVAPYVASKHALEAISDALRVELRPWGIQ